MEFCREINSINCELSGYRKGFLSIRLDLVKGLIVWKDSNHWCNNFVRSLTFQEIEMIRRVLPDLCRGNVKHSCQISVHQRAPAHQKIETDSMGGNIKAENSLYSWQMTINRESEACWCLRGHSPLTESWRKMTKTIEQISRIPVRLQ